MKDQVKWMEGEMESTEPNKPDVFITGATPNKQLKNQVTYDYRTPTLLLVMLVEYVSPCSHHHCCNTPFLCCVHFLDPSLLLRAFFGSFFS
jgi:hypothetical protein